MLTNLFLWKLRPPLHLFFLKKAAKLKAGAKLTGKETVGSVTRAQIKEIAESKMKDLNANNIDGAMQIILGSARSMGIEVKG
jgi:large subunit ribosomal protein L11